MRKIAQTIALFLVGMNGILSTSQEKPEWLFKEFSQDPVPVADAENFLNQTCQTSGMDGIQLLAVQPGHGETMHLHIYCRSDKAASGHYKVAMIPVSDRNPDKAIKPYLARRNVKVGPFYFGKGDEPDGVLIIEKDK